MTDVAGKIENYMFNDVKTWIANHFGSGILPPFSFIYADKSSEKFLRGWKLSHSAKRLDDARTENVFTYLDLETALQVRCECIAFKDFSAIEWVLRFKNNGRGNTPIIEDIQAIDTLFARKQKGEFVLHRALGSAAKRDDFAPVDELIEHNLHRAPIGGRSSNTTAFPFFNIEAPGEGGVMLGIGWSGQWAASFSKDGSPSLRVRAGMELSHLKLHLEEEIRTPRILLLFWKGDDFLTGHNLLRRFVLAHHMPKKDGQPVTLPFSCCSANLYDEANRATEQNQIDFASRFAQYGVEYLWVDAGWFEGGWPNGVGNWFVRKDGFPDGLKPIADALKKMKMGLILWFEPERVHQGSWLDRKHPEWVIKLPGNSNGLLNLGNEDARRWLTEHISAMIEREGISVYRHDFNMDPLPYWQAVDDPDRQGITEIRYIEGLYAFWDELVKRHTNLIIDNCASGGRRIDLETISRSVVLWRTDYQYFEPNGYQSHTYGISLYLPSTSTGNAYPDAYSFRSSINDGIVLGWNIYHPAYTSSFRFPRVIPPGKEREPFPVEQAQLLIEEFRSVRHLFFGDFYPLTPHSITDDTWMAYQFHREDLRQGMVLAFRRHKCPIATIWLKFRGLSPTARYEVDFKDINTRRVFTGEQLAEGLDIEIEEAPGSLLIMYRQLP